MPWSSNRERAAIVYFRRQSADYLPGSGFVAVADGVAPALSAQE